MTWVFLLHLGMLCKCCSMVFRQKQVRLTWLLTLLKQCAWCSTLALKIELFLKTTHPFNFPGAGLRMYVTSFKYLGHIIENDLSDDRDINREIKSLYTRTNILIRRFSRCSFGVKNKVVQNILYMLIWCCFMEEIYCENNVTSCCKLS